MSGKYDGIDWHTRARALQMRGEALINGRRARQASGDFKQSGTGRDKSLHAFDKHTELKTTWIDLA